MHEIVIGANEGLIVLMQKVHQRILSPGQDGHYHPVVVDVAVFERILKLMYGPQVESTALRDRLPLFLGLWHPMKHLMELVWRRFAPVLFAPMTHFIWPGSNFYDKPRTIRFHTMFALCAAAQPSILGHLDATVTQLAAEPVPDLRHLHWAQNLLDLFDFFVPIVSVDAILVVVWDDTLPLSLRHISPTSLVF